jgi:hypothetical protein
LPGAAAKAPREAPPLPSSRAAAAAARRAKSM